MSKFKILQLAISLGPPDLSFEKANALGSELQTEEADFYTF